jgi:predicted ATP-binding protein involved in virulence
MYLKKIELANIGSIKSINKELPFHDNGNPKPLIIIGQNGSGKSIFISHIVNALLSAKQAIYEDAEIQKGMVFKIRDPSYIQTGANYAYSNVLFETDFYLTEWQLGTTKSEFEKIYSEKPNHEGWEQIESNNNSHLISNFLSDTNKLKDLIDKNCLLYFPANRFEEPAWLNYDNLINKADYRFIKRLSNLSNRTIINYSPLKDNQNWLLDILLDQFSKEINIHSLSDILYELNAPLSILENLDSTLKNLPIFLGHNGQSNNIHDQLLIFIKLLFQTNEYLHFVIGERQARRILINKNKQLWIPNLFNLSTGETALLNIFLTIIKDYDLTTSEFQSLADIRGIVIIDEIDVHLHSTLQYTVLPQLIKLFPKVQFILSTHSPLFLLGLRKELGFDNFEIINLPDGQEIDVENFSEFETAYNCFKDSVKFNADIKSEIEKSHQDILFVEGDYDIRYLKKAAELLGKEDILDHYEIKDAVGYGNMNNVSKHFNSKLTEITPQKILLLYDCDIEKSPSQSNKIYKRTMPSIYDNPIEKGIENLFTRATIEKAIGHKSAFIDITSEIKKRVRDKDEITPEKWEANKDEKGNLCNWLVEHGQKEDFENFSKVFDILEEVINHK